MNAGAPARRSLWLSVLAVLGCAILGTSVLAMYARDVGAEYACRGSPVCGGFRADPTLLIVGSSLLLFATGLGLGIRILGAPSRDRTRARPRLALTLAVGIVASLVIVVTGLSLSRQSSAAFTVGIVAGWIFLGTGYFALWLVTLFPAAFVGSWARPAQGLALGNAAVSAVATAVAVARALGPAPGFL